jgi:predicted dehydrogenase
MKEKTIKWGVIGSGGIARRRTIPEGILRAPHAKLISVYDINADVNKEVAARFHAAAVPDIPELLGTDIDAVYVGSPVHLHIGHVQACAGAGKHVFCEKPLGLTVREAEQMAGTCSKEGVILGTGFMMRFLAQHQAALKIIQAGRLGKPVYGRAQLSCWYPPIEGAWRQDPLTGGGGSLMDMGSHCMDLLEMFFGKVSRVSCFISNSIHGYASEDSAVVILYFENGAMATVDAFFCIPDYSSKNVLELYGSKGSILARGTIGQADSGEMTVFSEDGAAGYDARQARAAGEGIPVNPAAVNTYMAEIEEFCCAILENRQPFNHAGIGLRNQKLIEACYQAAKTGTIKDVP